MLTHWEILTAIQSNVPVNDSYAQLWGKKSQNNYTIVTYTGTLPATLIGTKAGYLHRYKIYGNTEQTGTPTPENPIEPQECGERTENLFDVSKVVTNTQVINQGRSLKVMIPSTTTGVSAAVPNTLQDYCPTLNVGDEVTLSFETTGSAKYIYLSGANISWIRGQSKTITATILSSAVIWYASGRDTEAVISNIMLNSGSTALPYEPYGYKLPLTSAGQNVDIYLGESQTTRRIKKLVLTGEETFVATEASMHYRCRTSIVPKGVIQNVTSVISTHYFASAGARDGTITLTADGGSVYFTDDTNAVTAENFKSYLAAQYAAGTPVTIWYVLAEPETGTLNEPLRKIGNYADTIDSTQTDVQIPTTANSTTISWAGEGLAPSQVELEYEKKR